MNDRRGAVPSLTGIRGAGAIWVVLFHYYGDSAMPIIRDGYLGVDMFFILSGFILTRVHLIDFETGYSPWKYSRFLVLRVARIYPLHLFVLLIFSCFVFTLPGFREAYPHPGYFSVEQLIATAFLVHNWRMGLVSNWNVPTWSLSAEWLGYIAFPVVLIVASWIKWRVKPGIAALSLLCTVAIPAFAGHAEGGTGILGLIRMAGEFFAGCILCQFVDDKRADNVPWRAVDLIGLVAVAVALVFPQVTWLSTFGFAGMIVSSANSKGLTNAVFRLPPMVFLGEISYSVYLTHWPIIQIRNWLYDYYDLSPFWAPVGVVICISGFSILTWHFIERPGREYGRFLVGKLGRKAESRI